MRVNSITRNGKRFFAPALAFLTILGCGGDRGDLPCLACPDSYYEQSSSSGWQSGYNSSSSRGSSSSQSSSSRQQSSSSMSSSSRGSSSSQSSSSRQSGTIYGASVSYGGETYETVVIGTQTWFKRNLNYEPSTGTSACYGNEASNCSTYGRLYDWATAMALSSSCNSTSCSGQVNTKHRGICPSGWHIPSNADWDKLMRYADGSTGTSSPYSSPTAGRYLKAASGWGSGGNGEDTYGFSALPGGYGYSAGDFGSGFLGIGILGYWWSSQEYSSLYAYYRVMIYNDEYANYSNHPKIGLFSVRCVQD